MSYLVLARKYRPSVFGSVSGQEHVTRTLANALKREKVVHAYLFTGPRGVGKTSVARILSKAINCQSPRDSEPCLECSTCREIGAGTSMAVREIDGASHNSVDNVRDLMDSFKSLPPPGYKRKVYIIDEVHMLSISAFNALLKSLEEPPPHTVFILATTDVHKVPETVISRCQRHDFRALNVATIEARLREVCSAEGISAEADALKLVARMADGSMRDAQTLLDRVQSFCEGEITALETSRALGTVDQRVLFELSQSILSRDPATVLERVGAIFETGIDPSTLLREFVHFWREVFVAKLGGDTGLQGLGLGQDTRVELIRLVASLEATDIQDLWDMAREGADRTLRSAYPRYGLEALVVRMATRQPVAAIGSIIGDVLGGITKAGAVSSRPSAASSATPTQTRSVTARAEPAEKSGAPKVEATVPSPQVAPGATAQSGFAWESLLSFASGNASRVLFENLKRLRPSRCDIGVFEATGPEFTATSLMRERAKLEELFNTFLSQRGIEKPRGWKLVIQKGQGAVDAVTTERSKAASERDVNGHPAVQSLQKIFPGSKVEQVRGRDS